MADDFDQEDPFKKYGGSQIKEGEDPFAKYGGKAIVKKKDKPFSESLPPLIGSLLTGGGVGSSNVPSERKSISNIGVQAGVLAPKDNLKGVQKLDRDLNNYFDNYQAVKVTKLPINAGGDFYEKKPIPKIDINDNAGNTGTSAASSTYIGDTAAPVTTTDANVTPYYGTSINVTLTPTDAGSGVASTYYCFDDTNTCNPTTAGLVATKTCAEGIVCTFYVRFYSIDNLGNTESVKSTPQLTINNLAPYENNGANLMDITGLIVGGALLVLPQTDPVTVPAIHDVPLLTLYLHVALLRPLVASLTVAFTSPLPLK